MRYLLAVGLLLSLVAPALARQTPADVVRIVYDAHAKDQLYQELSGRYARYFTPGFLGIIERARAKKPGTAKFVDFDFFYNVQDGGMDHEIGETKVQGTRATVYVQQFQRGDYRQPNPDPDWRKKVLKRPAAIHLADIGQGWQIMNIVFLPHQQAWADGKVQSVKKLDVREVLGEIAR